MKIDQDEEFYNDKFGGCIDEADSGDNHAIQFVKILDFDKNYIMVPYNDPQASIKMLFQNLSYVSSNKQKAKNPSILNFKHLKNGNLYTGAKFKIKDLKKHFDQGNIAIMCLNQINQDQLCVIKEQDDDYYDPDSYKPNPQGKPLTLSVKALDKLFKIQMLDTDPIGRFKEIVGKKMNVFWPRVRILHIGNSSKNGKPIGLSGLPLKQTINVFQQKQTKQKGSFCLDIKMLNMKKITLEVDPHQKVCDIIAVVAAQKNLKQNEFRLVYSGKRLEVNKRISDFGIKSSSVIYLVPNDADSQKNIQVYDKNDTLMIIKISNTESIELIYGDIKSLKIEDVIQNFAPNAKSFWSLFYGNKIFYPYQKVTSFQPVLTSGMTIQVITNQKYFFSVKLKQGVSFPKQQFKLPEKLQVKIKKSTGQIKQRVIKKVSQKKFREEDHFAYIQEEFYSPIQYYTCPAFYKQINLFLRNLNVNDKLDYTISKEFRFVNSLIENLKKIPNHIGVVYRGMQKFKFSTVHKVDDIVCWKSFTSTSSQQKEAKKFAKNNGSLFHINSLHGKPVDAFSFFEYQKQVIFIPFTYFYVEKIQIKPQYDYVQLTQVPSPITFKKDIIVWVDDIPTNNINIYKKLDSYPIQILPLYSTKIADKWMKEFNYLLNWLNIRFKVISDMVRYQTQIDSEEKKANYEAGIDLLQSFYNNHGFTTKILVFCGDAKKGMQNIQKRKIKDKIWSVTNAQRILLQYCDFNRINNLSLSQKSN